MHSSAVFRNLRALVVVVAVLAGLILQACGDDDDGNDRSDAGLMSAPDGSAAGGSDRGPDGGTNGGTDSGADVGGEGERCVRSKEALAQTRACLSDEDCPCGAGCDLGVCASACASDEACGAGQRCDSFGRCRAASDRTIASRVRASEDGALRATHALVTLPSAQAERSFDLIAEGSDVARARVVADPGLTVRCGDAGEPAESCSFADVTEGERMRVFVRATDALSEERGRSVRVFTGRGSESVGVVLTPPAQLAAPGEAALERGVFEGAATALATGAGDPTAAGAPTALTVPLTAKVYLANAGNGVLALEDPGRILVPSGSWVGRITTRSAGAAPTLALPSIAWLAQERWKGAAADVIAAVDPVEITVSEDALAFELPVRFEGVVASASAPFVRLRVSLARVSDLDDGEATPSVPASAVLAQSAASRALAPTPWEATAIAAIGDENVSQASDDRRRELLASFALRSAGATGTLAACTMTASDVDTLGRFAASEAWGLTTGAGASPLLDPTLKTRLEAAFRALAPSALALNVVDKARPQPRALPCQVAFTTTETGSTCDPTTRYRLGTLDVCDAMAEAYGCAVEDVEGAHFDLDVSGDLTATLPAACSETLPLVTVPGAVSRVCRLPVIAQGCAELALCWEPPPAGDPGEGALASLDSARFSDDPPLAVSGDLSCEGGGRSLFALDLNQEQTPCPANAPSCARLDAQQVIDACADEIARVRDDDPPAASGTYGMKLRALFAESPACVDLARVVLALGFATEPDRRRILEGAGAPAPLASRIAQRLVQRIAAQATFAAREAAQRERLAEMFRESGNGGRTLPTPEQTLAELWPIWDLLLHPRFASGLAAIDGAALAEPDYRDVALGRSIGSDTDEIDTGLPVALVDLATAQLDLLEQRVQWAALDRDASVLEPLGLTLRYGLLARALAADMRARAASAAGATPLAWAARFDGSVAALDATTSRVLQQAAAITSGRNPLGIEEEDLPLFFLGDEQSATSRFSAISDFLIGQKPGAAGSASAWAPNIVARARDAYDAALPDYVAMLDRQVQVRQSDAELAGTLEDIRLQYGTELGNICYPDDLNTRDLLEKWDFSEHTCFYRSTRPECVVNAGDLATLMSIDAVRYQMCVVGQERAAVGPFVTLGTEQADLIADDFSRCGNPRYPEPCPAGIDAAACLACDLEGEADRVYVPLTADHFRAAPLLANLQSIVIVNAEAACAERFPDVDPRLPSADELPGSPVARADCYNGSLGEAVFDLRAAQQDVVIARREFEQGRAAYDIAVTSCAREHLGATMQAALLAQHGQTMSALERTKLGIDVAAEAADASASCFEVLADEDLLKVFTSGGAAAAYAGLACAAHGVTAALHSGSLEIERQMAEAERSHELAMQMTETETAFATCMNDAEMELVGQQTAAEQVAATLIQTEAATYRINELKVAARTIYEDGRGALAAARDRHVRPLTHDYWLDERLENVYREMRFARRAVYLAVRAVEYEQQQSLPQRAAVLGARLPDELWNVLDELWTMTGTRGVGGNRPTDLKVVLSLRKQLLQLADRSDFSPGEHALSDVERFQLLLTSPRYAVYDDQARYQGQRIPFTLAPLGTIGLGDPQGIAVLAGDSCAERLWSVNASVLGADLYRGDEPSFTRIDLLKKNTFSSQWCRPDPKDGPATQTVSVRPSRNLFRDPEYGASTGAPDPGDEATLESRARIEAYFNVDRAHFESDDYAAGGTSELAARGLYGDYALFIPAGVIAQDANDDGLVLEHIDDILLRLDYVSVAR